MAIVIVKFDLSSWEPFDAWAFRGAVLVSTVIAVLGLVASVFVPQAYCRFGCLTGSLLKFVRSHGANDCFGLRELIAGCVILVAGLWIDGHYGLQAFAIAGSPSFERPVAMMSGEAFGATWTVEFSRPVNDAAILRDAIAHELERIDSSFSSQRKSSLVSAFNTSVTTLEMEYAPEFVELVARLKETLKIDGKQPGTGRLSVSLEFNSLRKEDANMVLDLDPILPGYAVDQLVAILRKKLNVGCIVRVGNCEQQILEE